jgi:hypothetical protein
VGSIIEKEENRAFTAIGGKPHQSDNYRGVGRGVNIKYRMGRDSGGYEINDPIL